MNEIDQHIEDITNEHLQHMRMLLEKALYFAAMGNNYQCGHCGDLYTSCKFDPLEGEDLMPCNSCGFKQCETCRQDECNRVEHALELWRQKKRKLNRQTKLLK